MNLMHANEIDGIKRTLNILMYGYEFIEGKDGNEYCIPNYQFFDDPDHLHFMNEHTVNRLYGTNAERLLSISVKLSDIADVKEKYKDVICFRKIFLVRHFPADGRGVIKPRYMDNHSDVAVKMIPSLIKTAFLKRLKDEPFSPSLD